MSDSFLDSLRKEVNGDNGAGTPSGWDAVEVQLSADAGDSDPIVNNGADELSRRLNAVSTVANIAIAVVGIIEGVRSLRGLFKKVRNSGDVPGDRPSKLDTSVMAVGYLSGVLNDASGIRDGINSIRERR